MLIVTLFQAYFIGWGLFVSFFGGFFSWRLYSRVDPDHRVKMKRLFVYVEGEREGGREIPRDRETDRPRDRQTDRQRETCCSVRVCGVFASLQCIEAVIVLPAVQKIER